MKLLFIVNDPSFFISHRLPIALSAKEAGYDVHIATMNGRAVEQITDMGFEHHPIPLTRSGKNLFSEIRAFFAILFLILRIRPSVLHLVTIKPVLYGGLASRLVRVDRVVAAVSGLGFVFMSQAKSSSGLRMLITWFYRLALSGKNVITVFQNPNDQQALITAKATTASRSIIIRGSGVDLSLYTPTEEPIGDIVVTLAARLLRDKGVVEFVDSARLLRSQGVEAIFRLVGDIDPGNPTSLTSSDLDSIRSEGIVEVVGHSHNISNIFAHSHIVVLPSYREGLPKVLVEAAACSRPIVTTDVPGCRDAIIDRETGLLVPVKDVQSLAKAIKYLAEHAETRLRMGHAGRELAERDYSIENIVQQHLDIYR